MTLDILTAVPDPPTEAGLVAALSDSDCGIRVVRRCVDLADLLAASAAGLARAVIVSADLRRLDRDALTRLAVAGVAVVGLVPGGDQVAERRLRALGVRDLLPTDAEPAAVAAAVVAAVGAAPSGDGEPRPAAGRDYGDPAAALPPHPPERDLPERPPPAAGRLLAVWGPTGAPGRSTVAITLAAELAAHGSTLLLDADVYGGSVAQLLGVLDEAPGIAAACRLANAGSLDLPGLAELAVPVTDRLRVLTGISRADRWPELRPSALAVVLGLARAAAAYTVVDCGFCLEQDEELAYDTAAPRRNGATLAVLDAADEIVGVAAGDPVGLQRYVRGLGELAEAVPGRSPLTVVNRVRRGPTGPGEPRREIARALQRYAGVEEVHLVPLDLAGVDAATAAGRTLTEAAPRSPARLAVRELAARLAGATAPPTRRLLRRG